MAQADIVATWLEGDRAYVAARVVADRTVDGAAVDVEYIASVPATAIEGLTAAQRRAVLGVAIRAERERRGAARTPLGVAGTLSL